MVGIRSLPAPHLVAEMGLTINALPHTFVLSDKLLAVLKELSQELAELFGLTLPVSLKK
jgi:hypothetical protein